jgi:general secretion pathway protein G
MKMGLAFSLSNTLPLSEGRPPDLIQRLRESGPAALQSVREQISGWDKSRVVGPSPSLRVGSRDSGYTLVELLVVVAILGLLTLIATPFVLRYLDSAKVSTSRTEIANISAGLDLFKIDIGRYPTTEEGLDALMKAPAGVDNWNGPYIKKATGLKDPWGRPYLYRSPGQHGEFDIYSYGAKGEASASGEKPQVANW